jgi:hypothetical protein
MVPPLNLIVLGRPVETARLQRNTKMDTEWHRDRQPAAARAQGPYGFYDSAYQIAIILGQTMSPEVVVDHECTHVNLVQNSSLGRLEQVLVFLTWAAREEGNLKAESAIEAMQSIVCQATDLVHESAAWFGTELLTAGLENLTAPARYRAGVRLLRNLFERMPGQPFGDLKTTFPVVVRIADDLATCALNAPFVKQLWTQPSLMTEAHLRAALRATENDPSARLREICKRFEHFSFAQLTAWSEAMEKMYADERFAYRMRRVGQSLEGLGLSDLSEQLTQKTSQLTPDPNSIVPRAREPTLRERILSGFIRTTKFSMTLRSDLSTPDTARLLADLAKRVGLYDPLLRRQRTRHDVDLRKLLETPGLFDGRNPAEAADVQEAMAKMYQSALGPDDEDLVLRFEDFERSHTFDIEMDRYAQVCVLESGYTKTQVELDTSNPEVLALIEDSPHVTVSLSQGEAWRFTTPPHVVDRMIFRSPPVGLDANGRPTTLRWDLDIPDARAVIAKYSVTKPVIASSIGYDFFKGDYNGVDVLHDYRHIVVAIRDFRSLWSGLSSGLKGNLTIECCPISSPSSNRDFGFLAFKPAGEPFPVVLNPSLVSKFGRIFNASCRMERSVGVELALGPDDIDEWLGDMADAVKSAIAILESEPGSNPVWSASHLRLRGLPMRTGPADSPP